MKDTGPDEEPAGFWSYAHADDDGEDGRLTRLAGRVRAEFAATTGSDLVLFLDRDALSWGSQWRARIDAALRATTFFVPLVTPRYFRSPECRRELLGFAGHAESLGLRELLLPVYYIDVPGLSEDSADEAVALVAGVQWEDWRGLRLEDEHSSAYRKGVARIAARLAALAAARAQEPRGHVRRLPRPADDRRHERLARWHATASGWASALAELAAAAAQVASVVDRSAPRLTTATTATEREAEARRLARELVQPAERVFALGSGLAARSVELAPGVLSTVRAAADQRDDEGTGFFSTVLGLADALAELAGEAASTRLVLGRARTLSDELHGPVDRIAAGIRGMEDAHTVVGEWARLVRRLPR
ncbi:TIR domain-containing protein [Motilibacter deserti]|uniref:TIR domain-containing protein n=1 Tax=Motilibacter deserti TaxID=2714956 RepID=A0ABX0GTE2_9ACTN|nr:TIR domain-containing protein [Motilibacter deserti]